VVLADCVYFYIHSEKKGFDTAIDIPLHLISDIRVEPTPLDSSIGTEPPADLILHVKCTGGDQAYVNSESHGPPPKSPTNLVLQPPFGSCPPREYVSLSRPARLTSIPAS
jgi:hypothetical protein